MPNLGEYFGRCYLVFSNVHSTANKTVWGDIRLTREEAVIPVAEPLWSVCLALGGAAFASKKGQRRAVRQRGQGTGAQHRTCACPNQLRSGRVWGYLPRG